MFNMDIFLIWIQKNAPTVVKHFQSLNPKTYPRLFVFLQNDMTFNCIMCDITIAIQNFIPFYSPINENTRERL